jgi:hypothetical protein
MLEGAPLDSNIGCYFSIRKLLDLFSTYNGNQNCHTGKHMDFSSVQLPVQRGM